MRLLATLAALVCALAPVMPARRPSAPNIASTHNTTPPKSKKFKHTWPGATKKGNKK